MKLSLIFELLLIFVLLAFAASKSVKKHKQNKKTIQKRNDAVSTEDNSVAKYCKCTDLLCNCCRFFQVPVLNIQGPGCASLMYLKGDKMAVSVSFGKKIITNRTLSSRKPSPICMPLPGGISKFCGRVYNIARAGEDFRACLGLELQAKKTVEAAVRVSCFKFGPRGVTSEAADPLPLVPQDEKVEEDDDDDDDDDDDFGLGDDDDDEDDDDDDDDGAIEAVNEVDSADYTGFSLLGDDLLGNFFGSTGNKKPSKTKKKQAPTVAVVSTTRRPRPTRRPIKLPSRITTPRTTPTRITTVRIRPAVSRRPTRRPQRRPSRPRPNRKPTTASSAEISVASSVETLPSTMSGTSALSSSEFSVASSVIATSTMTPTADLSIIGIQTTAGNNPLHNNVQPLEPVNSGTQSPSSVFSLTTTSKTATNMEDPGIQMSLAHITGQLSSLPVTEIIQTNEKFDVPSQFKNYEKINTISPKTTSTRSPVPKTEVNDDMVQIVQSLDSHSEESSQKDLISADESKGYINFDQPSEDQTIIPDNYESISLPKQKHRGKGFDFDDLDVIGLSEIGETVGDQLGLFGRNKRQHRKNKESKVKNEEDKENDYYDEVLGLDVLGELGITRRNNRNNKERRRENKMMRGDWSHV